MPDVFPGSVASAVEGRTAVTHGWKQTLLRAPVLVALTAFAVRFVYLGSFRNTPFLEIYFSDQLYYRDWAQRLAAGGPLGREVFEQGPLYAYVLAGLYRCLGFRDLAVLGVQLLLGTITALLVYFCARRLFGERAALASGLLAAAYGPLVFVEAEIMKTFLEPLLTMIALWCALRHADRGRPWWLAASGFAVGLLCLVREVHVLLVPALATWAWSEAKRRREAPRRRLRFLTLLLLAFALPLSASAIRNRVVAGESVVVTSGGGEVAAIGFGPSATGYLQAPSFVRPLPHLEHEDFRDEARLRTGKYLTRGQASRYWYEETFREVRQDPGRALRLVALKAALLLNDFEFPDSESFAVMREFVPILRILPTFGWVAGLGLLGIALSCRESRRATLPVRFLVAGAAGVLLTYHSGRFRAAMVPLWLLFAGNAAGWLLSALTADKPRKRWHAAGIAAFVVAASGLSFLPPAGVEWGAVERMSERFRDEIMGLARHRQTISGMDRAFRSNPRDPYLLESLAFELENTGKIEEAARLYEKGLSLDPKVAGFHWRLADIRFRQGLPGAAAKHARAFVQLEPGSAEGHLALAVFLSRLAPSSQDPSAGNLARDADEHFREALRLAPGDPMVHYYLGKTKGLAGDVDQAIDHASRAVDLRPDFPEARHLLRLLLGRQRPPAASAPPVH